MNLVQAQNQLRSLSDQQIQQAYAMNSGEIPPFLILAEAKRRADMRQAGAQQQTAAQASQPSVAEQIMAPPQPMAQPGMAPQGAAPAQGAPMGQSGMPQMQGPTQGGIKAFREGGQVRGFNEGGWLQQLGSYLASDPVKRLFSGSAESMAPEPAWRDPNIDFADEARKKKEAEDRELDFAMDRPKSAQPVKPKAPVPPTAPTAPTAPSEGIASIPLQGRPVAPIETGPTTEDRYSELQSMTRDAYDSRPRYDQLYAEIMKGAPDPNKRTIEAYEKLNASTAESLKRAEDQRLQNFFLNLAAGTDRRALTNVGSALKAEAEGFSKTRAEIEKRKELLTLELAKAQDAGDVERTNRALKGLQFTELQGKSEAELRKEMLAIENAMAAATSREERLALQEKLGMLNAAVRAASGGAKEVTPEKTLKDLTDIAKDSIESLQKGGNAQQAQIIAQRGGVPAVVQIMQQQKQAGQKPDPSAAIRQLISQGAKSAQGGVAPTKGWGEMRVK